MSAMTLRLLPIYLVILGLAEITAAYGAPSADTNLRGVVKAEDGKPLEGVAVSARAQGKTFTTTVYTDRKGQYFFPVLEDGQYNLWAQAVGFAASRAELKISSRDVREQPFPLKPLPDFSRQLSGTEWLASLPEDTPEDRRRKAMFRHNCTGCHISGFLLQNRFDAEGWGKMIDLMSRLGVYATGGEFSPNPFIHTYKEELVEYLTRARGPNSAPLKYKLLPRPTGEATQIVVTEYDIPQADKPGYIPTNDGSDWSQGTPSSYEGRSIHDMVVDQKGNVWFGNTIPLERTIGKLDPRTGRVTDYKLAGEGNQAIRAIGLVVDAKGNVWSSDGGGNLARFDPQSEKFQRYPRPPSVLRTQHSFVEIDSKGNLWVQLWDGGASKFDPRTEEYTDFQQRSQKGDPPPDTYGIAMDSKDNPWYTQMNSDRIGTVDARTGEVSVMKLNPLNREVGDKDREIGSRYPEAASHNHSPLYLKGPRRIGADRRGNTVWVAHFWEGRIAKIDLTTRKVTEYDVPHLDSLPYMTVVDKNHTVWVSLMNSDRIAKFDPLTERFTEYALPTLGTEARHITVEDRTDPPTVWIPYYRVNKIARVQFRPSSAAAMSAQQR